MKKLGTLLLASFIAGAGLATPTDNVQASELPTYEVTSSYSTQIVKKYTFSLSAYPYAPPNRVWYDDGRLRGWLHLGGYILDAENKIWIATYDGTVYSGAAPMSKPKVNE